MNLFDLSGRVAVVVGATSGLGRALAIGLAKHRADVAPTGRRRPLIETACEKIEREHRRTLAHPVDGFHRASIDVFRDAVLERFGSLKILVCATGVSLTPMARFGDPCELVRAAVLLAGDGASFVTQQSIVVDGGYLAAGVLT